MAVCEVSTELEDHRFWLMDGLRLPLLLEQHQLDFLKTMEHFEDDVWICTFPRSGTTWTQQIVRSIRSQSNQDLPIDQAIPYLEGANSKLMPYNVDLSTVQHPRAFKSHMPYNRMPFGILPKDTPCKYIYVARNPKDQAVSYFYYYVSTKSAKNLTFENFVQAFAEGQLLFGDYFEHVLSWWEHKDDNNVLFLKYEDMKKDTRAAITKIADFIDIKLTQETIESVIAKSSFLSMKMNPTTNYDWLPKRVWDTEKIPFIRKGIVGGWKDHFTQEQSETIDALYCKKFKAVGLDFDFE